MYEIKRIKISGYRKLYDLDFAIRPLNVLIGANGVGKTTLLDALLLLSASASGALSKALSDQGGTANLLTRGKAEEISFSINMVDRGHPPISYDLSLTPNGPGYQISRETLSQDRGKPAPFYYINSQLGEASYYDIKEKNLVRPGWEFNRTETSLSQVPKMFPEPEEFRRILGSMAKYHVLDVGQRAPVKLPQQMRPADQPGADGEDLVSFLYSLRESDRNRYEAIEDTLRVAFPGFESLSFPPVAAGMLAMTWNDSHYRKPFYMHELSEGTLRFLWLVSLLQSPSLPTITMIDEPEVSLHPELLSILADLMREASRRTKLVVATHSDRFISFLKPEEVVVMDSDEEGFTTATWADTLDLDEWLEDYSLDEVWRLGRMGGRS